MHFEEHLVQVHRRIRSALIDLFESIGADPSLPQALSTRLGINKNLAWRLCKIVQEGDPYLFVRNMPGVTGTRALLRAFESEQAPAKLLDATRDAVDEFNRMVELHAGDRATLEMMPGGKTPEAQAQQYETHRKLAFRGNSFIWGVQARVQLTASFIAPSNVDRRIDVAKIGGLLGFRRLRSDVAWPMLTMGAYDGQGQEIQRGWQPLDSAYAFSERIPLLEEFSTSPTPEFQREQSGDGTVIELPEGPVGAIGATDCLFGTFARSVFDYYQSPGNTVGEHSSHLVTPVELYVSDLFFHRDLDFVLGARPSLCSRLAGTAYPAANRKQLPMTEEVQDLGSPAWLALPEFPPYRRLVDFIVETMQWNLRDFHGLRLRMPYPPIPSWFTLTYDLPEA